MSDAASDLDRALEAIRSVRLPHPDGPLLECFLQDATDPEQAARYVLRRCSDGRNGLDLADMLSDWKQLIATFTYEGPVLQLLEKKVVANISRRDGGKCCITGLSNSFCDELVVAPILPVTQIRVKNSLHEMLEAFIGPDLRAWVLSDAASLNAYQNHWLVRKSAATAMLQGFFQLRFSNGCEYRVSVMRIGGPTFPSIIDKTPKLRRGRFANPSTSNMSNPHVSALQILSRFAKPIRWRLISREIERKRIVTVLRPSSLCNILPLHSLWRVFLEYSATTLIKVWRLTPASIRIRAYRGLAFLGARLYGPSCSMNVQRLPLNMYLKTTRAEWHEGLANEYGALQLLRRHTHVPAPRSLDIVSDSETSYLLTSRVPGLRLGTCIDTLSDDEEKSLVSDLQKCLEELRPIRKEVAPNYAITNALGNACYDYRINACLNYDKARGDFVGPFANEEEFNETLRTPALPTVSHRSGHKIVFTHADLNMRNILMHNGRLSGIVDWENSGWFPEYWDLTKAHYITKLDRRWLRIVDDGFERYGNFEDELRIEFQLWNYCC